MNKAPAIILLVAAAVFLCTFVTSAQTAGLKIVCFELTSGAGQSSSGRYSLKSTVGQLSTGRMSGGSFTLNNGCQQLSTR